MGQLELYAYAWFRIVFGFLFLFHGLPKIFGIYGKAVELVSLRGLAGIIELVCGSALMFGLFTRSAALLASGQMAVAYFYVHQSRGVWPIENGGELAALYCFAFLYIACRGSGIWSIAPSWKAGKIIAMTLLIVAGYAKTSSAQQVLPKVKLGDATLDVHGWAHSIYNLTSDTTGESVRMRVRLTQPRGFGAFLDFDLVNLTKQGGIKRAAITYNATPNWQVLVGRFPTAPFYFAPSDISLETVQYARTPFTFYATGAQTSYRGKSGWSVIVDITGNSSKRVYDRTQLDRIEVSARLSLPVRKAILTPSVQVSDKFVHLSVDIANTPTSRLRYRALVYATNSDGEHSKGGYAFVSYAVNSWLDQHNQIDLRHLKGLDPVVINGLRLTPKLNWFILTAEHQWYPQRSRNKKRNFFLRAQVRY